jgi:hypothetical protein
MALIITTTPTTTPAGNHVTLGQMVSDVAEWYGFSGDNEREGLCRRAIQGAVHDLNRKRLWRFNLIEAASFNTVVGTATYSLTTIAPQLWRVYNLRNSSAPDYTLMGTQQGTYDMMFQSQSGVTGAPFARVDFNIYRDSTIKIQPAPDGVYSMTLRYFKVIDTPTDDTAGLDLPQPYQTIPKYQALYHMGLYVGSREADRWKGEYEQGVKDMEMMDDDTGDEILRFYNVEEVMSNAAQYGNLSSRPRYLDFY